MTLTLDDHITALENALKGSEDTPDTETQKAVRLAMVRNAAQDMDDNEKKEARKAFDDDEEEDNEKKSKKSMNDEEEEKKGSRKGNDDNEVHLQKVI